jgi:LytR cell envelope-related transcriptional attenuator
MSTTRPPAYDQAPGSVEPSRRGAHRARAKPALAGLPILAGILIVVLAAGGAWYVLGSNTKDSSSSVAGAVPDDGQTAGTVPASAAASGGATTQASATTPAASPTKPGATTQAGTTTNSGQVDKSIAIRVLNSVPVQGLAARVATNLRPDGWNVTGTSNSKQKNLVTTKVYYGGASTKATAQALVKDLGFGVIDLEPAVATNGLVVVLGKDAES